MRRMAVLTQPRLRVQPWLDALDKADMGWMHWPLSDLAITPGISVSELHERIAANAWTLLPSPSAVILLMRALSRAGLAWPSACGLGLIGPGSHRALKDWLDRVPGLREAALIQPAQAPFDAAGLMSHPQFSQPHQVQGLRVLVLHRPDGQDRWLRLLLSRGARLEIHAFYHQRPLDLDPDALRWLAAQGTSQPLSEALSGLVLSVASRGAGLTLLRAAQSLGLQAWMTDQDLLTHHPAIAQAMHEAGFRRVHLHDPGVDAFIAKVRALESRQSARP